MEEDKDGFIFESPDGGKTVFVFKRTSGSIERELISTAESDLFSYAAWFEIKKLSETNTSIKIALDHLLLIYYTIKDDKDSS